jgi:hypothetical protein
MTMGTTPDKDYEFGAQLTAYKSSSGGRYDEHQSSRLVREDFDYRRLLVDRVATLVAEGYDDDEMELLVFLDAEKETARVVRYWAEEFTDVLHEARRLTEKRQEEAADRAERDRIEKERLRTEATEKAERSNYERLKAKYEGV